MLKISRTRAIVVAVILSGSVGAQICGDCTGDGVSDIIDALNAAQHSAGIIVLAGQELLNCNVDEIGLVTVLDALSIAQHSAGLPVPNWCGMIGGGGGGAGTCGDPVVLTLGPTGVGGDSTGRADTIYPSCQFFSFAADVVYEISFTGTRTLTVNLTSSFGASLYVKGTCTQGAADLACSDMASPQQVVLPSLPGGTYFIVVDGSSTGEGTFTLQASAP